MYKVKYEKALGAALMIQTVFRRFGVSLLLPDSFFGFCLGQSKTRKKKKPQQIISQPQREFEKKRRCQTDIARVLRGYFARKKFKKLLLRLPRFAAPLLQRCIRIFQVFASFLSLLLFLFEYVPLQS